MVFRPTYGWFIHMTSAAFCLITLLVFAAVWIPAGLLLELPLRLLLQKTLFAPPESFLTTKPGTVGKIGREIFRDYRDWFKIYYTLYVTFILWPAAIYMMLYCNWDQCLYQAGIYYVLLYGPRLKFFINMFGCLHTEAHLAWTKGICRPEFAFFNHHLEYALGTLAGHIPELTGTCHVKVHHTFSNRAEDTESLLAYNRLSAWDYLFKFLPDQFTTHALNLDGFRHFYVKQNWAMWKRLFQGTAFYGCFAITVIYVNPLAAFFLVLVPLAVFNLFISVATWTQHTFLYNEEYERSTTILLDQDAYAEAVHLSHHMNPLRHPFDHRDWLEEWKLTDSKMWDGDFMPFIFRDLDNVQFFVLLMLGRTKLLANKFVDIRSTEASQEEIANYLKRSAQPIEQSLKHR